MLAVVAAQACGQRVAAHARERLDRMHRAVGLAEEGELPELFGAHRCRLQRRVHWRLTLVRTAGNRLARGHAVGACR